MKAQDLRIGNYIGKSLKSGQGRKLIDKIGCQDIVQTFRRLGQQMSGWQTVMNKQDHQYPLIKKLFKKNGLEISGGGACPEQYDVLKNGKQVAYFRLRHGEFRVDYPDCGGETIYEACPNGDGIFDDNERLNYLAKAMRQVLLKLKTVTDG